MNQIVVAWVDLSGSRPTGRQIKPDGVNTRAEFEACEAAHAAVWLRRGSAADVEKARRHVVAVAGETGNLRSAVYIYPTTERDPLGRARAAILGQARADALLARRDQETQS